VQFSLVIPGRDAHAGPGRGAGCGGLRPA
jgi:hypothetical protein